MPSLHGKFAWLLLVLMLAALPAPLQAAATTQPAVADILAASSSTTRTMWLAEVAAAAGDRPSVTSLWQRSDPDRPWQIIGEIPARVTSLAGVGDSMVALLEDGSWQYVGLSTGEPLPQNAKMLAIASDGETLYALGRIGGAPATLPTTAAAEAATAQATLPAGLHVFKLERGDWQQQAILPLGEQYEISQLALGVVKGSPVVAMVGTQSPLRLQILQYSGREWKPSGMPLAHAAGKLRVFESDGRLTVWVGEGKALGTVYSLGHQAGMLTLPGQADAAEVCDLDGYLRVFYAKGPDTFRRLYDPGTHRPEGGEEKLSLPRLGEVPVWLSWTQRAMFAVLVLILSSMLFRRKDRVALKLDWRKVQLAPLGRRIAAGAIDSLPLLVGAGWIGSRYPNVDMQAAATNPDVAVIAFIAGGAYVLYLTICEMVLGRSLGKLATGLRIVRFDGRPASAFQLFVRNFLRIIDLWMGVALILALILPLRQRLGDVAAGTIVVADAATDVEEDQE